MSIILQTEDETNFVKLFLFYNKQLSKKYHLTQEYDQGEVLCFSDRLGGADRQLL